MKTNVLGRVMGNIIIAKAEQKHFEGIWEIFHEVVRDGDTYVYDPHTTKEQAYEIWMKQAYVYIALLDGEVAGSYTMRPNYPGLGSHVANCSYIVNSKFRGKGIGKIMGEHSIKTAKESGFMSMQFNIVVSSNIAAVNLWQYLGFKIIATTPKSFKHPKLGFIDTYIMHQFLK